MLTKPRFEDSDGSWFKVDIKNNLNWAVGGYDIAYVIKADDRSTPIEKDSSVSRIPGGIEPGETKTVNVWAGADIASYKSTGIQVSLINVFDAEDRRLVDNNINYIGMSPDLSPHPCK